MATKAAALFEAIAAAFTARDATAMLRHMVLPYALYQHDELRVLSAPADLERLLIEIGEALDALGVKRTMATIEAETLRCDECCQVWVELSHLDGNDFPLRREYVRFFLARGTDGHLRLAMEEMLSEIDPALSGANDNGVHPPAATQSTEPAVRCAAGTSPHLQGNGTP